MNFNISLNQILAIIILAGLSQFFFVRNLRDRIEAEKEAIFLAREAETLLQQKQAILPPVAEPIYGLPVRLKIPEIDVDALIEHVGVTPAGEMDIPEGRDNVAWFRFGPNPGEKGSAVIAGHYGPWKGGKKSVFEYVSKLKKGDKIYVIDEAGATTTFAVRETRKYNPAEDASDVFGSSDGNSHLNLVTCEGDWIAEKKTYSNRLVVFADKE